MDNQHEPGKPSWPVEDGEYIVGDPAAPVAVCVLTSADLMPTMATLPGVAISGTVYTANLGIEKIIQNVTANPAIRFLLLCGRDSPLFQPGQTITALMQNGVDGAREIIGAEGYLPELGNLSPARIAAFRQQIELVDCTGESDVAILSERIRSLTARNPGRFSGTVIDDASDAAKDSRFVSIKPGGRRQPLAYDPNGFFVVSLDRAAKQIIIRHYQTDNTPAHEMRGRAAESMMLGLLRENLVSQMSHAGYLGGELAKAETALKLGLRYVQDKPLRNSASEPEQSAADMEDEQTKPEPQKGAITMETKPKRRPMGPAPATAAQLAASSVGEQLDAAIEVSAASPDQLTGIVMERDDEGIYHRTAQPAIVLWGTATQVVMGKPADIRPTSQLQVHGKLAAANTIEAQQIAIVTGYVEVS